LLTGTGIVPPEQFTLAAGDTITVEIERVGRLQNQVMVV
jgi:2-dehydro-3-deoxy-D-arabinonate dehydratase